MQRYNGQIVTIGSLDYEVTEITDLRDEGRKLHGEIEYGQQAIRLEEGNKPQFKRVTLLHEIVHGIFENAGQPQNEQTVDAVAYGIDQVLRDNEWLRKLYDRR